MKKKATEISRGMRKVRTERLKGRGKATPYEGKWSTPRQIKEKIDDIAALIRNRKDITEMLDLLAHFSFSATYLMVSVQADLVMGRIVEEHERALHDAPEGKPSKA